MWPFRGCAFATDVPIERSRQKGVFAIDGQASCNPYTTCYDVCIASHQSRFRVPARLRDSRCSNRNLPQATTRGALNTRASLLAA
jgi:hypothetical protein